MKKNAWVGILYVLLAGIFWGSIGVFVRFLQAAGLASLQIVAIRVVVTSVMLLLGILLWKPSLLRIHIKDIWIFLCSGLISIVLFSYFYYHTISLTTVSVAAVLLYVAPIIVMFLCALLFQEKLTTKKICAAILAFLGCALVVGLLDGGSSVSLAAIGSGLASAFCYALYSIFSRFALNRGYHPLTMTLYTFLFANIGILPLVNLSEIFTLVTQNTNTIVMSILLGLITSVIPYIFYTMGLSKVETAKASIMASVEPVVATLFSVFLFGETLSFFGVLGIILVLSAIVLLNLQKTKKE